MIVVHDGKFHADEVVAYSILKYIFNDLDLVRTRNPNIIKNADFVCDVGFIYDPNNNRFDHHQNINIVFNKKSKIPLSSAGMVYRKYGRMFIRYVTGDKYINDIYNYLYNKFLVSIDAIDNGIVNKYDKYHIFGISEIISSYNDIDGYSNKQYQNFIDASKLITTILEKVIINMYNRGRSYEHDYTLVDIAFKDRYKYSKTGEILVVTCENWKRCIFDYENKYRYKEDEKNVKFIIYKSLNEWRIRTIGLNFNNRQLLRGNHGISGLIFFHKKRFIASSYNFKDVLKLGQMSLNNG